MLEKHQLTPVEYELMEILWRIGQGTVREVIAHLSDKRNLAYTSVSTILRILQQKKILAAKKMGRRHVYIPILSKETFTTQSIKKMVKQVFSGNSLELVTYLVENHELTIDEINMVQKLLNSKKQNLPNVK